MRKSIHVKTLSLIFWTSTPILAQVQFPDLPTVQAEEDQAQDKSGGKQADSAKAGSVNEKGTTEKTEKGKKDDKEADKKTATKENQLSEAAIDRTGEWIPEFERQFAVRKTHPEFEFLWGFNMLQEFHAYNNADLRKLNSSNDFQIRTTDDQQGLALTRAKFDTSFMFPKQRVGLEMSFGFDGVWGSFQMQGAGNPGTRIARANIFWEFYNSGGLSLDTVI
ncbi:MAG: hypothetical protein N2Z22_03370, partial [Turneriella sp.]|nr:hypothetical protein [Turneriella sp.]